MACELPVEELSWC